jgi:hypothetical protein
MGKAGPGTLSYGKSHFIQRGVPICAALTRKDGSPQLAPFKCEWGPERQGTHRCAYCKRVLEQTPGLEGRA